MEAVIDFETRSSVDINKCGAFVYAEHPDTEIMCLSLTVDDEKPVLWIPEKFQKLINIKRLKYNIVDEQFMLNTIEAADEIIAQNSMFEYLIWNVVGRRCYDWPKLPLVKLHDTMAQAAYHALPLNLDQMSQALNLPVKKDMRGHSIMLKLCKPRTPRKPERAKDPDWADKLWWHEDVADLEALFNYGGQDAEVERMVYRALAPLPDYERKIWLLDQKINLRGVPVDVENVKDIVKLIGGREYELRDNFQKLTKGKVSGPKSYIALKDWINEQTGMKLTSVDKSTTDDLLKKKDLPELIRNVLNIKAEISKSSVSKFKAMLNRVNADGRLRGMFQYGGASTLRWAARGVQLQNQPRDSYDPKTWEEVVKLFRAGDLEAISLLYDDPFFVASRCVRGALCTKNEKRFICADFKSIEAVGNAYLSGDIEALEVFRKKKSPYRVAAGKIFNTGYDDVTKEQRQVGKVSELALGYGGGIGAYASMAKTYSIDLETLPEYVKATRDELDGPYGAITLARMYLSHNPDAMSLKAAIACDVIKRRWRASHPDIVAFWKGLELAAFNAVIAPGKVFSCGNIHYAVRNKFLKCKLPSGRLMHYYLPRISSTSTMWDDSKKAITYMGMKVIDGKTTRQWIRLATYGGKLCENVVQGFCRDLLAEAMLRLEAAGYPQCLHVHDEAAAEVNNINSGPLVDINHYSRIMSKVPKWAEGMPISADGWIGKRYRKD